MFIFTHYWLFSDVFFYSNRKLVQKISSDSKAVNLNSEQTKTIKCKEWESFRPPEGQIRRWRWRQVTWVSPGGGPKAGGLWWLHVWVRWSWGAVVSGVGEGVLFCEGGGCGTVVTQGEKGGVKVWVSAGGSGQGGVLQDDVEEGWSWSEKRWKD